MMTLSFSNFHTNYKRKMKPLEKNLKELKWVQRDSTNDELVSGDEVLGTLHWQSRLRSLVTAESAYGKWTFKRGGFLRPIITIREYGKDHDLYSANIG